jgi:choline monooxygenase
MPGRQNLSIGPIVPRGPERTARFLDYFLGEDADDEWLQGFMELDEQVGVEDRALVESVQRGIGSGALESGVLLPESEQLIARFQALVLEALGD